MIFTHPEFTTGITGYPLGRLFSSTLNDRTCNCARKNKLYESAGIDCDREVHNKHQRPTRPGVLTHFAMGQLQRSYRYWVSVSFNSLFKVLFNFPSQYLFAIGHVSEYLALDGTYHPLRAVLPNSSTQPSVSRTHPLTYGYRTITFFGTAFQSQISPLFQSMHNTVDSLHC